MAEVVRVFDEPVVWENVAYTAQVAARPEGHVWEAWIEFVAADGSDVRRTARETTQPDRDAIVYWASGLSGTYLEGALRRTFVRPMHVERPLPDAAFNGPAPTAAAAVAIDRAVLDPFSVGAKGETLLRQELSALAAWHLRNIVRAYHLTDETIDLERLTQAELIELIVAAVAAS